MKTFIKRFKSRKISHFLRPVQLVTGAWAIETRLFNKPDFEINMNYPLFDTAEQAEEFLAIVIKEVISE